MQTAAAAGVCDSGEDRMRVMVVTSGDVLPSALRVEKRAVTFHTSNTGIAVPVFQKTVPIW
jgi:hypothetical protein